MTKIDVFSGFLGAGKTTMIKKLLKDAYAGQKVVLIENEFGEIGIDGGLYRLVEKGGKLVREEISALLRPLEDHYITDILKRNNSVWITRLSLPAISTSMLNSHTSPISTSPKTDGTTTLEQ